MSIHDLKLSFEAKGANIAAKAAVKLDGDNQVVVAASADDSPIGIADYNGGDSGEQVAVHVAGVATATAGGAVVRGTLVGSTAGGKVITAAANKRAVGVALTAAAKDGDSIEVLISPCKA